MNLPSTGSTGRSGTTQTTLAEINVTPLVDVMLVLLIVFMVTAPLMQQGVQVDLPKANAGSLSETPEQVVLEVKRDGSITMDKKKIPSGTLMARLTAMASVRPDIQVFVKADQKISYGYIARVMATVKQAKIRRVGLVTQPGDSKPL